MVDATTAACSDGLADTPIRRCLIFAQHKAVLDVIEETILKPCFPSVNYARLDGTVPPKERGLIAKNFNEQDHFAASGGKFQREGEDIRILLLTARASGLGLNLTAASTVIFVEHDWNPYVDL